MKNKLSISSHLNEICKKVFIRGILPNRVKFSIIKPIKKKEIKKAYVTIDQYLS